MDRDERPRQPSGEDGAAGETRSRRKFLRQFGVTTAAAAAAVGAAELIGLAPASAAAKVKVKAAKAPFRGVAPVKIVRSAAAGQAATPDCGTIAGSCTCVPGWCGGPCPSGYWCNFCNNDGVCGSGNYCVKGGCNQSWHRATVCIIC